MVRALPRPPPWVCMARARFGSHEGIAVMRTKADRLEKLVAMMAAILAAGCIAHGQAARSSATFSSCRRRSCSAAG